METYLFYRVDEGLGITFRETSDHLDLIGIGQHGHYQSGALVHGKTVVNQTFPGGRVTTREKRVKLAAAGMDEELTARRECTRLPKHPGAIEDHDSSTVASIPTSYL